MGALASYAMGGESAHDTTGNELPAPFLALLDESPRAGPLVRTP